MRKCVVGWLVATTVAVATQTAAIAQPSATGKLKVTVSILPQAYFVERVGGDGVDVSVLVGPGQSPHSYEPTPKQMADLAAARAYFSIGVEFEKGVLPRIRSMFPDLKIVDTRDRVPLRAVEAICHHDEHEDDHADEHDEDHNHEHAHEGGLDPHIWLSPRLVKIQARTVCDTLCKLDTANAEQYRRNLAAFEKDLDGVHGRIADVLKPLKGREVFVFHPAFGYFTDEFDLKQVPVEIEGKQPTARQLAQLIERARSAGVKVVFVEPQFSRQSADAVAQAIDGAVVPIDPLARDYLKNLENMADKIKVGLERSQR